MQGSGVSSGCYRITDKVYPSLTFFLPIVDVFAKSFYQAALKCLVAVIVLHVSCLGREPGDDTDAIELCGCLYVQLLQLRRVYSSPVARILSWMYFLCGLNYAYSNDGHRKDSYLTKMPPCLQDDVVMGTLTVRENLQFSAALRLPTTMKNHEKNERINMVIKELGLEKVADSKV